MASEQKKIENNRQKIDKEEKESGVEWKKERSKIKQREKGDKERSK